MKPELKETTLVGIVATCINCGAKWQTSDAPASAIPHHANDFSRYSFLCSLLAMFGDGSDGGFKYKIERKDNLVQIWMLHPVTGKQEFASLNFDGDKETIAAELRRIIQQIVFFTA